MKCKKYIAGGRKVDNFSENIKLKESVLIHALGSNTFNNIRDFFQSIEYGNSMFNIYVSKKCYTLFLEFRPFLKLSDNKVRCTDVRIPFLKNTLRGNRVTIIDDILIHGRTLTAIRKELLEMDCDVEICVLAVNQEAEYGVGKNTRRKVYKNLYELQRTAIETKQFYKCSSYLWKKISDLIMRSFWATNTPYSAYLPVLNITKTAVMRLESLDNKNIYRMECPNHSMTKMGLDMEYLFVSRFADYLNDNSTISQCLFVLHKNSVMNSYKILPVTILNEACYNNKFIVKEILNELFGHYSTEITELLELDKFNEDEMITTSCIKFLIYSLNRFMMEVFLSDLDFKFDEYIYDNENLEYSFGKEFEKYFIDFEADQKTLINIQVLVGKDKRICWSKFIYKKIMNCFMSATNKILPQVIKRLVYEINDVLFSYLKEAVLDTEHVYSEFGRYTNQKLSSFIFARFLKLNSDLDEKALAYREKRILGLKVSDMLDLVKDKTNYSNSEIIVGFFNQFYLGASTIVIGKQGKKYGIYCHAGEQSYKCIVHEFVPLVYFSYRFDKMFVPDVSTMMCNCYKLLAIENYDYFNIPFSINDYNKYSLGIRENIYDIRTLQEHCVDDSTRILCWVGFMLEEYVSITPDIDKFSNEEFVEAVHKYIIRAAEDICEKDKKYLLGAFGKIINKR